MFKVLIALFLFVAIQGQLLGGFTDRPDLLKSPVTQSMIALAVSELANSQNVRVIPVDVVSVGSQVVNGVNYEIIFTARSFSTTNVVLCSTKLYQTPEGVPSVSSVRCA